MIKSQFIVAALLLGAVFAGPAMAKPMTCPACKMPMPTKKTAMMTVPVYSKADKTVYYCCPQCAAGKAATKYMKIHHHPMPV
jgi:RNase P subunit RPR2